MSVAGTWDIRIKTPIGDQTARLTIVPDGSGGFAGTVSGDAGSLDVSGQAAGATVAWKMKAPKPMPLDLDCRATVTGDTLNGEVKAGMFGTMTLTGVRVAG